MISLNLQNQAAVFPKQCAGQTMPEHSITSAEIRAKDPRPNAGVVEW